MTISEFSGNKKQFIHLLLLADEQEDMIDRYIDTGVMYILDDNGIRGECIVSDIGGNVIEIMNLAVEPLSQGNGYGRALIDFIADKYKFSHSVIQVGTGDSPLTVPFYEKCGFTRYSLRENFFIENYDHPIFECGVQLRDMVVMRRQL